MGCENHRYMSKSVGVHPAPCGASGIDTAEFPSGRLAAASHPPRNLHQGEPQVIKCHGKKKHPPQMRGM